MNTIEMLEKINYTKQKLSSIYSKIEKDEFIPRETVITILDTTIFVLTKLDESIKQLNEETRKDEEVCEMCLELKVLHSDNLCKECFESLPT